MWVLWGGSAHSGTLSESLVGCMSVGNSLPGAVGLKVVWFPFHPSWCPIFLGPVLKFLHAPGQLFIAQEGFSFLCSTWLFDLILSVSERLQSSVVFWLLLGALIAAMWDDFLRTFLLLLPQHRNRFSDLVLCSLAGLEMLNNQYHHFLLLIWDWSQGIMTSALLKLYSLIMVLLPLLALRDILKWVLRFIFSWIK